MTSLTLYDPDYYEDIGRSKIAEVFETKVYYLFRGRNAWRSTWVTHYFNGCMHDDFRSAKDHAKEMREKGSVFTIQEQPALALRSTKGIVVVTEINNNTPLYSWIKGYKGERSDYRLNQNRCRLEYLVSSNLKIDVFIGSLRDRNNFPDYLPTWSNNTFVLVTPNKDALDEDRRIRQKRWKSSSDGANYYLGWNEVTAGVSGRAVRRVADALATSIEAKSHNLNT